MKFDAKAWLPIGIKLVSLIPGVIGAIEKAKDAFKSGGDKEDAAITLIKTGLFTTEQITDKDILNDDKVEAATREAIQAVIKLQNAVALAKASREK